jgi:hypothetical protein
MIAKGLDRWLEKYGWYAGGKNMEERVKMVLYVVIFLLGFGFSLLIDDDSTHRPLTEKTGIFTFIGIGRKEDPRKKDLSIQVYVSPELYENPRLSEIEN